MERSTNQTKLYILKQIYVPSSDPKYTRKQLRMNLGHNLQLLKPISHMQC